MTTITEPKQTPSAMVANMLAMAHQATKGNAAQTRGLVQNGLHPAAEAFARASNSATKFGRGNLEAATQSAQIYLSGMQDLRRQYLAAMTTLTQHAFGGAKGFANVKSLRDAMALQAQLTRALMEQALDEGGKLQRAALALTEQVHAPLAQRMTMAFEQTMHSRAD
ncbi:phasin family protein [Belnapia moabensis]|uniref:phasin family protein n=1 Tax=Belnapia moabensis TaxID=365533 RepID=UPI000693F029|nr:phasin family protein [Belnapia moabensis]